MNVSALIYKLTYTKIADNAIHLFQIHLSVTGANRDPID